MNKRFVQKTLPEEDNLVVIQDKETGQTYDFTSKSDIQLIVDRLNELNNQSKALSKIDKFLIRSLKGTEKSYHESKNDSDLRGYYTGRQSAFKETKRLLTDLFLRSVGE